MNSKDPSIRALGQRSIHSSFPFRASNRSKDSKEDVQIKGPNKDSRVSLSDFLDRKLHKTSVMPKTVQGKQRPFSWLVNRGDVSGSIHGQIGVKKEGEAEVNCVLDEVVFEQFKHTRNEKEDCIGSCSVGEVVSSSRDDELESRKRRNPFEGVDEKPTAQKHLVVLGDDPKPKQNGREESFICNKKPKPLYNHYANGSGWWDCDMEGVDNEEVGCGEVWEGMGSTTLGGLEWH